MFSKRELEGELIIDHRESPGITLQEAFSVGMNPIFAVGAGKKLHVPTYNCHCCERLIVVNPGRTRDRAYCPQHDAYLCDECEVKRIRNGKCIPFKQVIDEYLNHVEKGLSFIPFS
jgi:hypothetical protein